MSGDDNVVADTLSRIEELQLLLDFAALASSQENDEELKRCLSLPPHPTWSKRFLGPKWQYSAIQRCPFVMRPFHRIAFSLVHNLVHVDIKSTGKLVTQRFVWPSMCAAAGPVRMYQKLKISRHGSAIGALAVPYKVRARSLRHYCASFGRETILPHVCRLLYTMTWGVTIEKPEGRDHHHSLVQKLDLSIWNACVDYNRPGTAIWVPSSSLIDQADGSVPPEDGSLPSTNERDDRTVPSST